jgi:hypothetical protein
MSDETKLGDEQPSGFAEIVTGANVHWPIEPVLSAEEWREWIEWRAANEPGGVDPSHEVSIALANASLPDDSPYKITQTDIDLIRESHDPARDSHDVALLALAAKLAAFLPPVSK